MEKILLLAHTESDGTLARPALEALAAALGLGGELTIGLVGAEVAAAASQIASCGAKRFLAVSGEAFAQPRYATDAAAAEALSRASGATVILAPSTSRWSRALPGVAFRLGGRVDTHATSVTLSGGMPALGRWFYRQRMEAVLTRAQRPWLILLDAGCVPAWSGPSGTARVESIAVEAPSTRTTVTGHAGPQGRRADHPAGRSPAVRRRARAGPRNRPMAPPTCAEADSLILGFLRAAQASLGGSKSLVDLSGEGEAVLQFMTHLNQIGQTGATPRHPKGLSTCCHGEEPHVVGWRFVNQRRAINLDPNCGWARGKADVLYVADAFEVMREVNRLLGA